MVEGYRISSNTADMDIQAIHAFISNSYWSEGIAFEALERSVKNSLCFGVFTLDNQQIGFARVITDRATFAYLADVYVLEPHRGKGLSKWLVETVLAHPDLQGLRRITLATVDAHNLYKKYGFESLAKPDNYMEIWKPDIYQTQ